MAVGQVNTRKITPMQLSYVFMAVWSVVMVLEIYHLMGKGTHYHDKGTDEDIDVELDEQDFADEMDNNLKGFPNPDSCAPRKNLFYLKIHKTASSTTTAMLFHRAWANNLTIVPVTKDPGKVKSFLPLVMRRPDEEYAGQIANYNIMAEHVRYNMRDVNYLLGPDAAHVASIRYPLSHLKSMFAEYRLAQKLRIKDSDPIPYFINNHKKYKNYLKNPQTLQFGIDEEKILSNNLTTIREGLKFMEAQYDQVLVTEYFSESMILLRRRMCWETKDIINLRLRERKYEGKDATYTNEIRERHKEISLADYMLYEHFVDVLFRDIKEQGQDFWDELYSYKKIQSAVSHFCEGIVEQIKEDGTVVLDFIKQDGGPAIKIDPKPYGKPFTINALNCTILNLDTRCARNILRMRDMRGLCEDKIKKFHNNDFRVGFGWMGENWVSMHTDFCKEWDNKYNLPLQVMTKHYAYNIIL